MTDNERKEPLVALPLPERYGLECESTGNFVTQLKLWALLDDIDTLDDICKFDDKGFRTAVRKVLKERGDAPEGVDAVARPVEDLLFMARKS